MKVIQRIIYGGFAAAALAAAASPMLSTAAPLPSSGIPAQSLEDRGAPSRPAGER